MAPFYNTIPVKSCGKFAEIRGCGGRERWDYTPSSRNEAI